MAVNKQMMGLTPNPEGGGQVSSQDKPAIAVEKDFVDQMITDTEKVARLKNLREALGIKPEAAAPANPPKSEEKVAMNVAEMIKAIGELMPKSGQNDTLTSFLLARQEKLEDILGAMSGDKLSPQEALKQQLTIGRELDEEFKKRAGLAGVGGIQATNISELKVMAEIEQMKSDREERKLQHEKEMEQLRLNHQIEKEERDRRYKIEDAKWQMEYDLKKEEIGTKNDRTDTAVTAFTNIVTALAGSIDMRTGYSQQPQGKAGRQLEIATCSSCESDMEIPADAKEFTCTKCGTVNSEVG